MTSVFSAEGKNIPCTVIEAGPCVVTQVKTVDNDGYDAIQLGFVDKKDKHTPNAEKGHFKKAGTTPKRHLAEFKGFGDEYKAGSEIGVDIFENELYVDVIGTSKGKGFQGVVKRHGFSVLLKLHGQGGVTVHQVQLVQLHIPLRFLKEPKWLGKWVMNVNCSKPSDY